MVREDTLRGILGKRQEAYEQTVTQLVQAIAKLEPITRDIADIKQHLSTLASNTTSPDNLELCKTTLETMRALLEWIHSQQQSSAALGQAAPPPVMAPSSEKQTGTGSQTSRKSSGPR
jgi:hypothetical protein